MNNNVLKYFPSATIGEDIQLHPNSIGQKGFFISPKYKHELLYLPTTDGEYTDHADSLFFTMSKLFPEEKRLYYKKYKKILEGSNSSNSNLLDRKEFACSSLMASIGIVVFLNTSDSYNKSGIFFVPENQESLSEYQKESIKNVIENIPRDDQLSLYITVPDIYKTIETGGLPTIYTLAQYYIDLLSESKKI